MKGNYNISTIISLTFGIVVFIIGILNIFLVHPVPGVVYLLLSCVYFPLSNTIFRKYSGFTIPPLLKIILGIIIIMFTLGVSDLGDMLD
jgi:hypothetical protein